MEKYQWKTPSNVCQTTGSKWEYQSSDHLDEQIRSALEYHFTATKSGITGKSEHPLLLAFSGAGTGKSRLIDEFPKLAVKATINNVELNVKLKDAYVFKVNLENGTAAGVFTWPAHHIGSRMLHQMSCMDWSEFLETNDANINPERVLEILGKVEGKKLEDMTVMILVDGLQNLSHEAQSSKSDFSQVLRHLSAMVNSCGSPAKPFIICCISALVKEPVSSVLSKWTQSHLQLTLPVIDGKKIIDTKGDIIRELLVDDMGGHGRALEVLESELNKYGDAKYSSITLMHDVRIKLKLRYPHWSEPKDDLKAILTAVITGMKFEGPGSKYRGRSIEDYVQYGLLRFNRATKRLDCPFVWLWLISEAYEDLRSVLWVEGVYTQAEYLNNPEVCPQGFACWQHWEVFTAKFWCLLTTVYSGTEIGWHHLHAGAKFGNGIEPKVRVKQLQYKKATQHCFTTSDKAQCEVRTESSIIDPSQCETHILPAENNPGGDSYCFVEELIDGSSRKVTFAMSNKKTKAKRKMDDLKVEKQKAASENDLFIEYTTGSYEFKANACNSRCGVVSSSEFKEYFGPFASRAFFMTRNKLPNINTAAQSHLEAVHGIGKVLSCRIMENRAIKRFSSPEDAVQRVHGLGESKAALFLYDSD